MISPYTLTILEFLNSALYKALFLI